MLLRGLDHLQLAMPAGQEAQAIHFYETILGLRQVPKPAPLAARGGCWFQGPGLHLHLGVEASFAPARKAHPCFLVADLEAARQHLERHGVATRPDESLPDRRRFYADDCFGNRLEFLQDGDGFSQRPA